MEAPQLGEVTGWVGVTGSDQEGSLEAARRSDQNFLPWLQRRREEEEEEEEEGGGGPRLIFNSAAPRLTHRQET